MSDYLKTMNEEHVNLFEIANELNSLSNSFYDTGNETMADTLDAISRDIAISANNINEAVGDELNRQVKKSQAEVCKTLNVILEMNND